MSQDEQVQVLSVDPEFLESIIKNKSILSSHLTICNSPDQLDIISQFIIEHTERPGRIQELRRLKAEKESSASPRAAKKSARKISSGSSDKKPYIESTGSESLHPSTATFSSTGGSLSSPSLTTSAKNKSNPSPSITTSTTSTTTTTTTPTTKEVKPSIALDGAQIDQSAHEKPAGLSIPKLALKTLPVQSQPEKKVSKPTFNLNLGSLNENVDFEVSKEDLEFLKENQPMTPTRAKLEREAKKMALQANREARVLSARGERPKEGLFSPRVHLTEEVMNKKLRELEISIRVVGSEGNITKFKIKSLKSNNSTENGSELIETKQKNRNRIISELLVAEEEYLSNISFVNEFILKPVLSEKLISEAEENVIKILTAFGELPILHKSLIHDLKLILSKWETTPALGDIMNKHITLFRAYEDFPFDVSSRCLMSLARCRQQNSKIEDLVKDFEKQVYENSKDKIAHNFQYFIQAPFLRLNYYITTFQSLEKETPHDLSDHSILKLSVISLVELANEINTSVNHSQVDDINKQSELISAIEGGEHLMLVERKLMKEGGMELKELNNPSKGLLAHHFYYFFLFNDILVCCSLKKSGLSDKQFQHKLTVPLTEITSVLSKEKDVEINFKSNESWILEIRNSKDKDSWLSVLSSTSSNCKI